MSDDAGSRISVIQEHASAAAGEAGQALAALASLLRTRDGLGVDVLEPVQHWVRNWASFAEVAVGPLGEFVDRQRELADQMAEWARLQHELADRMAAWADMQRQLANAIALWLAPVGSAAHLATRVLQEVAGEQGEPAPRTAEHAAPGGKPTAPRRTRSAAVKSTA